MWIALYSLETMDLLSMPHLQMQCHVGTVNYYLTGKESSQPVRRDLFECLVSQWALIFDLKLFMYMRKKLWEIFMTAVGWALCLVRKKHFHVSICHSKGRKSHHGFHVVTEVITLLASVT
jgi:hypothetical protein